MVLGEEKDCSVISSSAMYRVTSGSGKKPQVRPRSIAGGSGFPVVVPRNGQLTPSEDEETDFVKDECSPLTPSIPVNTDGLSNGFSSLRLELEPRDESGYRRSNGDDTNDVKFSDSAKHRNGCDKTEGDNGQEEDVYGHLAEQIQRSEEHVPLHKSVCCALCR